MARIALVTGANRGIGRAVAQQLAALDHVVALGARDLGAAQAAAAEIGGDAFGVRIDITDPGSVDAAVAEITARTGRIDVVVNNAGGAYDSGRRMSHVTDQQLIDALQLNTVGALRVCRAALPHMLRRHWGRIVNVSSRSGTFAATWADAPAYGVSKAALNMVTFQLARELEGTGVLVNACCPGWVRTEMGGADADKSVEEGADTPVWLATLPDGGPNGRMFGERAAIDW